MAPAGVFRRALLVLWVRLGSAVRLGDRIRLGKANGIRGNNGPKSASRTPTRAWVGKGQIYDRRRFTADSPPVETGGWNVGKSAFADCMDVLAGWAVAEARQAPFGGPCVFLSSAPLAVLPFDGIARRPSHDARPIRPEWGDGPAQNGAWPRSGGADQPWSPPSSERRKTLHNVGLRVPNKMSRPHRCTWSKACIGDGHPPQPADMPPTG